MPGYSPESYRIPLALRQLKNELRHRLRAASKADGKVGDAVRSLASIINPHFAKEDEFALPPLSLLHQLATANVQPEMADVLGLTARLEAELPAMLSEHAEIVAAIDRLSEAARRADRPDIVDFARMLALYAQCEEQVMYPAALLVGRYVDACLNERKGEQRRAI